MASWHQPRQEKMSPHQGHLLPFHRADTGGNHHVTEFPFHQGAFGKRL